MKEKKKNPLFVGILSIILGLLFPIVGLILGIIGWSWLFHTKKSHN